MEAERYFEAKNFLKALSDAHLCIKTSIREKNKINFQNYQINNLYENLKNDNMVINNNLVEKGKNFDNSRQFKLNNYIRKLKNDYMNNLEGMSNYNSFKEFLLKINQDLY